MERQEPVIDSARTLQNRVKLTWREVRDLAAEGTTHQEPSLGTVSTEPALERKRSADQPNAASPMSAVVDQAPASVVPAVPARQELSEADRVAIAAYLAPKVEESLRSALRDAIDMALANAGTRVKSDVERSLGGIVSQTVLQELEKIDLAKLLKR